MQAKVMQYYSAWHYSAVHKAVGITRLQTVEALAERLNLSSSAVLKALMHLEALDLVRHRDDRWLAREENASLPGCSGFAGVNHASWRQKAVFSAQNLATENLHYTALLSLSRKDFES